MYKKIRLLLTALIFIIGLFYSHMNSCAEGNTIISLPTEDAQKIEDFIKLEMEDGEIPGLSVAIVMDEQIVFQKVMDMRIFSIKPRDFENFIRDWLEQQSFYCFRHSQTRS